MKQQIIAIKIADLNLWTENPRDSLCSKKKTDQEIISMALNDDLKWDLQKLMNSLGNFYNFNELPTVVKIEDKYIVFDGNRRIALIKYLQSEDSFIKKLKYKDKESFKNMIEIPCNVCDKETALTIIERIHIENGSWKPLERDYFLNTHRKNEKSIFMLFDEVTNLISTNNFFKCTIF